MVFWAYVLRCSDGSFYAGHTEDLENRLAAHRRGTIPGYTSSRLPVELTWTAEFSSRLEALLAERQIKGWSHAKKQALIDGDWERLSELSRSKRNQGD